MTVSILPQGWGWPMQAKKAHFFRCGTALCGRWFYLGEVEDTPGYGGVDDCRACVRKLQKEHA